MQNKKNVSNYFVEKKIKELAAKVNSGSKQGMKSGQTLHPFSNS